MCVRTALGYQDVTETQDPADFLLRIGEGRHDTCAVDEVSYAIIHKSMVLDADERSGSISVLIEHIYGDLLDRFLDPDYFPGRAILTTVNSKVHELSAEVQNALPGDPVECFLIDTVEDRNQRPGECCTR